MTIEGECLGEPAILTVDETGVWLTYTQKPGAVPETTRVSVTGIRPARLRGLEPFHAFALFFAIGAYFAHLAWLAIAFAAAGIAHGTYRLVQPPQVLVLDGHAFVVARRSLADARQLTQRAAP
jgi:hypothetical protein